MSPASVYRQAAIALHIYDRLSFWLGLDVTSLEAWTDEIVKFEKKGG